MLGLVWKFGRSQTCEDVILEFLAPFGGCLDGLQGCWLTFVAILRSCASQGVDPLVLGHTQVAGEVG